MQWQNIKAGRFFTILINRENSFTAILLLFFLTGIYLFVFGESGILERISLENKKANLVQRIDDLKKEKSMLQEKLTQYKNGIRPESDITDAGLISPGDKLIILKEKDLDDDLETLKDVDENDFHINRVHYRIIWVVISAIIFIIYFINKNNPEEHVNE